MSKKNLFSTFGIALIILPLLGFPSSWNTFFMIVLGIAIIVLSYRGTNDRKRPSKNLRYRKEVVSEAYVESGPISSKENNLEKSNPSEPVIKL